MTQEIQASAVEALFPELLDALDRGEEIAITREGRRIARIVPEAERRQQEIEDAIADLKALGREIREEHGSMAIEEILALRHEGRKY